MWHKQVRLIVRELHDNHTFLNLRVETQMKSNGAWNLHIKNLKLWGELIYEFTMSCLETFLDVETHTKKHSKLNDENHYAILQVVIQLVLSDTELFLILFKVA